MPATLIPASFPILATRPMTSVERDEMIALGVLSRHGDVLPPPFRGGRKPIERRAMHAESVLNEAYNYPKAASFTRGIRFDLGDKSMLMISGTASVDEAGLSTHLGDFRAQLWRTYRNITKLLQSEGATWQDVVKTTCYIRDIERDYQDFNRVRNEFFRALGLDPFPASVGIQARICRSDLLVEIEALAILYHGDRP
jgi:2-iminobutanoate/2-iminopropanoate deaminase